MSLNPFSPPGAKTRVFSSVSALFLGRPPLVPPLLMPRTRPARTTQSTILVLSASEGSFTLVRTCIRAAISKRPVCVKAVCEGTGV